MKKLLVFLSLVVVAFILTSCVTPSDVKVEGITITSEENIRTIKVNEKLQLAAKVFPEEADQSVVWSSSAEEVATVNESGLVSALSKGTVNIIATSSKDETVSQSFALIVEEAEEVVVNPTSVSITSSATTCKAGETIELTAVVSPSEASQSVEWTSSDTTIATVSRGTVQTLKEGQVTITVNAKGFANVKASVTITVEKGDTPIVSGDWAEMEFSTHAYYMTAEKESKLKVKGVVTHVSPVKDGKVTYLIQNGTEGYYVYAQDAVAYPVELGKVYEVGGYKKYYQGLNEIVNVEYFKEIEEKIEYTVNTLTDLDPTDLTAMEPYHCSFVKGTALFDNGTTNTKAYSFYANVNGKNTTFRVDPSYMSAEEFAEINKKIAAAVSGASFEFTGIMSAFGYGKASPQILVTKASDLVFEEMSTEDLLKAAATSIEVKSALPFEVNTIELATSVEGFDGLVVAWESDSELINTATGAVTHSEQDTTVTLTATLTLDGSSYSTTFTVTVFALDNNDYEVVTVFDCEDALEANSYGCSQSKEKYAEGNVFLGTPEKHNWMLRNALIGAISGDVRDGKFSIRGQVNTTADTTARIELLESLDFSVIEFAVATYGGDANGTLVRVEYSTDNGTTWVAHETIISVDSKELTSYRLRLPEGAKRVAIVLVEGSGRRVNIDNIKLMK